MSERQISPEVYILLETDVSNSLMRSFIFCVSTQNLEKKFITSFIVELQLSPGPYGQAKVEERRGGQF